MGRDMTDENIVSELEMELDAMLKYNANAPARWRWSSRRCDIVRDGIEAIREMQAELAARKQPTKVVPHEPWDEEEQESARVWATDVGGVESGWVLSALFDIERLKEELRIAKTSWNFEEGKRIIAERDELRGQRDRAQALAGEMRTERAAAMAERDDLRGKLCIMTALGKQLVDEASRA